MKVLDFSRDEGQVKLGLSTFWLSTPVFPVEDLGYGDVGMGMGMGMGIFQNCPLEVSSAY